MLPKTKYAYATTHMAIQSSGSSRAFELKSGQETFFLIESKFI